MLIEIPDELAKKYKSAREVLEELTKSCDIASSEYYASKSKKDTPKMEKAYNNFQVIGEKVKMARNEAQDTRIQITDLCLQAILKK
jgi:beta-glucosidase/6-phospho-beta-glucosidase/beta-galactosidase